MLADGAWASLSLLGSSRSRMASWCGLLGVSWPSDMAVAMIARDQQRAWSRGLGIRSWPRFSDGSLCGGSGTGACSISRRRASGGMIACRRVIIVCGRLVAVTLLGCDASSVLFVLMFSPSKLALLRPASPLATGALDRSRVARMRSVRWRLRPRPRRLARWWSSVVLGVARGARVCSISACRSATGIW